MFGDKDEFDEGMGPNRYPYLKGSYFTSRGFCYVSINYELAENDNLKSNTLRDNTVELAGLDFSREDWTDRFSIDDLLEDTTKALKWVVDHAEEWGFDTSRLIVLGHDAGAHLAACMSTRKELLEGEGLDISLIKACVMIDAENYNIAQRLIGTASPITTDGDIWKYMNVYGVHPDIDTVDYPSEEVAISQWERMGFWGSLMDTDKPLTDYAPHFCVVTRGEAGKIMQSDQFNNLLRSRGIPSTYLKYPGEISDGVTTYDHEGIHRVLGSRDLDNEFRDLVAINVKSFSFELSGYLDAIFYGIEPDKGNGNPEVDPGPTPVPQPNPEPEIIYKQPKRKILKEKLYAQAQPEEKEIHINDEYLSPMKQLHLANGPSMQRAIEQEALVIPQTQEWVDKVGLHSVENVFIKYTVSLSNDRVPFCIAEEGWRCLTYSRLEEFDPVYEQVVESDEELPETDPWQSAVWVPDTLPTFDGKQPLIKIELINKRTGNIYNDKGLDVRLYTVDRQEHCSNVLWIPNNESFYVGFHARDPRRVAYNVQLKIGHRYLPYDMIEDKREVQKLIPYDKVGR